MKLKKREEMEEHQIWPLRPSFCCPMLTLPATGAPRLWRNNGTERFRRRVMGSVALIPEQTPYSNENKQELWTCLLGYDAERSNLAVPCSPLPHFPSHLPVTPGNKRKSWVETHLLTSIFRLLWWGFKLDPSLSTGLYCPSGNPLFVDRPQFYWGSTILLLQSTAYSWRWMHAARAPVCICHYRAE